MEKVTKVFFDPLAGSKVQIRALLQELPIGSAHPFSPERLLLCRTETGVDEIDISSYPESHFFNAVDLGELGQTLQTRMIKFTSQLRKYPRLLDGREAVESDASLIPPIIRYYLLVLSTY